MISSLRLWLVVAFIFCLAAMNGMQYFFCQHLIIERDKAYIQTRQLSEKLTTQNEAITQLVIAEREKELEVKKAQEDAQRLRIEYNKAAKKILAQSIPKNCDQAVQWGAIQGHTIYECWAVGCETKA